MTVWMQKKTLCRLTNTLKLQPMKVETDGEEAEIVDNEGFKENEKF